MIINDSQLVHLLNIANAYVRENGNKDRYTNVCKEICALLDQIANQQPKVLQNTDDIVLH